MKKLLVIGLTLSISLAFANDSPSFRLIPLKSLPKRMVAAVPVKLSPSVFEMQQMRSLQLDSLGQNRAVSAMPSEINLTMNGVPVVFQGNYPTCVTFAVTAALNAAINKGDYISQLCLCQLSTNLVQDTYWHSLWDGASIDTVLSHISQHGIINTVDQKKGYCNKVKKYPIDYDEKYTKHKMSTATYHACSVDLLDDYRIEPQLLFVFAHTYSIDDNPDRILTLGNYSDGWVTQDESFAAVRKSLMEGNRVVMQFLFKGDLARGGMKQVDNDTWFVSKALRSAFNKVHYFPDSPDWYSHCVVLYGYNDNIITRNEAGESQKGVFYVRNSWGEEMLEYMTYDYFKLMSLEATSINTAKKNH